MNESDKKKTTEFVSAKGSAIRISNETFEMAENKIKSIPDKEIQEFIITSKKTTSLKRQRDDDDDIKEVNSPIDQMNTEDDINDYQDQKGNTEQQSDTKKFNSDNKIKTGFVTGNGSLIKVHKDILNKSHTLAYESNVDDKDLEKYNLDIIEQPVKKF
ncbi:hypothetical protein DLAC_00805 [Tieghemostelium lacteum]|uniref:Uncharacterized protein n=1 Tax=Tieghemostelium lacteum TaxID=361077 RepID=A0A152A701_TIELA|nr:hypothetical protein DLAC_00805 [Tieghemostelium lacteum]|eukprot:KYR02013.1 hypothetical protein DLAC_00805 [Tieghemostelium lacteum]